MPFVTPFTERFGLRIPILQAPMGGGIAGPPLVVAACKAGALGMLPIWPMPPDAAEQQIDAVQSATKAPFAVNLNVAFGPEAHLAVALRKRVPVVHFFWGVAAASPFIATAKQAGACVIATVGMVEEAKAACAAGADVLIAQGREAGGHVWGATSLTTLVPALVDAVGDVPVVAAGGISDGRGLAAVLTLGAAGAAVGTALIVADESGAHPDYKRAVLEGSETVLGTIFDLGWRDAPCRTLRNSTVMGVQEAQRSGLPRPGESDVLGTDSFGRPVPRYSSTPPSAGTSGEIEAMALYAGEGVGLVREGGSTAAILSRMVLGAEKILRTSS